MASLRGRSSPGKKVFLISGIEDQRRKDLARKIHLLGGKYFDLQDFKAICTHVICGKLSQSEKFLGACATGKWVLHPDYVYDSAKAGAWLDEEQYEWCDEHIARKYPADENLAFAPRRWRFMLGDSSAAFSGWKVAVIAGNKKSKVIKRLLISGGAEIYNIKIPVRNPAKVADTISYIFVSEQNMRSVISLVDYGVMCLKPEFIGDYLILDPQPDQMDYLVQVADTPDLGSQEDLASSQNSFLLDSQRSAYISPVKASSSATPDFSPLSVSSSGTSGTPGSSTAGTGLNPGPLGQNTPRGCGIPSSSGQSTSYLLHQQGGTPDRSAQTASTSRRSLRSQNSDRPISSLVHDFTNKLGSDKSKEDSKASKSLDFFSKNHKTGSSKECGSFQGYNDLSHNFGAGEYDKENFKDISITNEDNGILEIEKLLPVNSSVAKRSTKTVKSEVLTPYSETNKESETVENLDDIRKKVKQNSEEKLSDRSFSASQGPRMSSPARRLTKKQLHLTMNLSPITKFFKPQPLETLSQPVTLTKPLVNKTSTVVTTLSVRQPVTSVTTSSTSMSVTSLSVSQIVTPVTPPLVNTSVTLLSDSKAVITSPAVRQSNSMKSPEPVNTPESSKQLVSLSQPSMKRELGSSGTPVNSRIVEIKVPSPIKTSDSKKAPLYVKRSVSLIIPSPIKPTTQPATSVDKSPRENITMSLFTPSCINEQQTSAAARDSLQTGEKENSPTMSVEIFYKKAVNSQVESPSFSCSQDLDVERQLNLERTPEKQQTFAKYEKQNRKRKSTEMDPDSISPKRRTRSSPGDLEMVSLEKESYMFTTLSPSPRKKNLTTPLLSAGRPTPDVTSETVYRRSGLKKKLDTDEDLRNIVEDIKKGKLNSGDWYSSMFTANLREDEDVPESVPMQLAATNMIHATLEDNFTLEGLIQIRSHLSFRYHPQSVTISQLMRNVLQGKEDDERDEVGETEAYLAYTTLCTVLTLHPPITEVLQGVYLTALAGTGCDAESKEGAEWSFIEDCISEVLCSDDEGYTRNNLLLFKFILQMLEQNFMFFVGKNKQTEPKIKHMLFRMFWGPSYHMSFNTRCRNMMNVLSDTLQAFLSAQQGQRKQVLCEVLLGVLSIVAMVTESCRVVECGNMEPLKALQGTSTCVFVHEIARQLKDIRGQQLLHTVIPGLRLPWLKVGVCQQLLHAFDDFLLPEDPIHLSKPISLLSIVTQYFYLMPQFDGARKQSSPQSPAKIRTKLTTRNHATITCCLTENTDINKANFSQQTKKANKRNHKGETLLHLACIRNNVAKVKELLQIPGIDVNAKDNAEWTPLHEACNHGHIECAKELLKFVPSKTVDVFFNKEVKGPRKVDLLASNSEGITPLHDAVINNRLEVCRLLLQHGGIKLLQAMTSNGLCPIDLAETNEMASLLTSFSHSKRKSSESQETLTATQDSVSSIEELQPFSPSEALYQEVLYSDGTRVYANTKSLVYYIRLVTAIVTHYIKASHLDLVTLCLREKALPARLFVKDLDLVNNGQGETSDLDLVNNGQGETSDLDLVNNGQDETSLSPVLVSRKDLKHKDVHCKMLFPVVEVSTEKTGENLKCQTSHYDGCNNSRTNLYRSGCASMLTNKGIEANTEVNITDLTELKKELKLFRRICQYVSLFRTHLLKIAREEDITVVERELCHLNFVTEGLHV